MAWLDVNWPYVAGFFDGEGSVSPHGNGFRVSLYQNSLQREVLEKIAQFLDSHSIRCGISRFDIRRPKGESCLYITNNSGVKKFLRRVDPWVIEKFETVSNALSYYGIESAFQREVRWSYVAGFFDGEGSISVRATTNGKTNYKPQIKIYQCGIAKSLEHISEFLTQKEVTNSLRRYSNSPYSDKCFVEINRQRAIRKFLVRVSPYLIVKSEQAAASLIGIESRIIEAKSGLLHTNSARAYI